MDRVANQHTFWKHKLMHMIETFKIFLCFDPAFPLLGFAT